MARQGPQLAHFGPTKRAEVRKCSSNGVGATQVARDGQLQRALGVQLPDSCCML